MMQRPPVRIQGFRTLNCTLFLFIFFVRNVNAFLRPSRTDDDETTRGARKNPCSEVLRPSARNHEMLLYFEEDSEEEFEIKP
jgi:hypothetical protein